jgi:hypothetical protein
MHDPGDCIICGAAHCTCGDHDVIEVVQLPARDAAAARMVSEPPLGPPAAPAGDAGTEASAPLGDGSDDQPFSTATYRGRKPRGRSSRT